MLGVSDSVYLKKACRKVLSCLRSQTLCHQQIKTWPFNDSLEFCRLAWRLSVRKRKHTPERNPPAKTRNYIPLSTQPALAINGIVRRGGVELTSENYASSSMSINLIRHTFVLKFLKRHFACLINYKTYICHQIFKICSSTFQTIFKFSNNMYVLCLYLWYVKC